MSHTEATALLFESKHVLFNSDLAPQPPYLPPNPPAPIQSPPALPSLIVSIRGIIGPKKLSQEPAAFK